MKEVIRKLGTPLINGFAESEAVRRLNPSLSSYLLKTGEGQIIDEDSWDDLGDYSHPEFFRRTSREDNYNIDSRNEYKTQVGRDKSLNFHFHHLRDASD